MQHFMAMVAMPEKEIERIKKCFPLYHLINDVFPSVPEDDVILAVSEIFVQGKSLNIDIFTNWSAEALQRFDNGSRRSILI